MRDLRTDNEADVRMLQSDPQGLLLRYQETVRIIVRKYIAAGLFKPSEFEDVFQEVNAGLFSRISLIQAQYNGMSLFRTYLSVIIRNICLKEHDRSKRRVEKEVDDLEQIPDAQHPEDRVAIEREIQKFRTIISTFGPKKSKLLLTLKLHFRLAVAAEDLDSWFPELAASHRAKLIGMFGHDYSRMEAQEIYRNVCSIINAVEGKGSSPDALRKWVDARLKELLGLLNGPTDEMAHTEDTLRILLEDYFSPFLLKK